jgi:hypothetical protein
MLLKWVTLPDLASTVTVAVFCFSAPLTWALIFKVTCQASPICSALIVLTEKSGTVSRVSFSFVKVTTCSFTKAIAELSACSLVTEEHPSRTRKSRKDANRLMLQLLLLYRIEDYRPVAYSFCIVVRRTYLPIALRCAVQRLISPLSKV